MTMYTFVTHTPSTPLRSPLSYYTEPVNFFVFSWSSMQFARTLHLSISTTIIHINIYEFLCEILHYHVQFFGTLYNVCIR